MKKQYRYEEETWCKLRFYIYHDGRLVESKSFYFDEAIREIDNLKSNGYVYGYTKEEVREAKERYERMLRDVI
jgi:hypothetical protein